MAADRAAASGVDAGEGLRKRPVASSQDASAPAAQPVDDKKKAKKVSSAPN